MGIRMLNRRPAPSPLVPVPAFAAGASTARLVVGPAEAVRHAAVDLGRALSHCRRLRSLGECRPIRGTLAAVGRTRDPARWRLWADLARGYVALLLTLLPRTRPAGTLTVFVAGVPPLSGPPGCAAPC
ncbi:hypothetical protein RKD23_005651 [Streptomyces sp. SAI-170]|uniref:hypothetical protein n=1 Tax=Streptomyces sp. SAI-170 TaxID=3377729 RepID=UPI003C7DDF15